MSPRRALPIALAALVLAAVAPLPALRAQQEVDLTGGTRDLREAFDRARERIDELDFAGAVRDLQTIIEPRRAARAADLGAEEMKILCAAYDLRARAHYNLGKSPAAEADFEALLRLEPSWAIDRQTLSPKVVDLFDKVRNRMVGILRLTVDPPRARVTVDGDPVDARSAEGIGMLAGRHILKVEMDGYQPMTEEISAAGGQRLDRAVRLVATRRALEFITVPDNVKVSIDGAVVGTTSGPATSEVLALAGQVAFDASRASAPLLTPMIAPGEHRVTFERECYGAKTMAVKVELDPENRPLRFSPVTLDEAKSDLRIDSAPPGAEVYIDGARRGTTPLSVPGMCGGDRDIMVVKGDVGRWVERVRLTPGEPNTLSVRLRPTLLYAGTFRLDEWGRAVWSDGDKPILDALNRGLKTLNLVRDPRAQEAIRDAIVRWMIADPREARAGTLVPPDILKEAAEKTGADLVLAGLSAAGEPEHTLTLALYSVLHPAADRVRLRIDREAEVRDFLARLDSAPAAATTFWGLGLADTMLAPAGAPLVARVLAGSPAAQAGIVPGERILQVGEQRTTSVKDLLAAMEAASSKSGGVRAPVVLTVDSGKGSRTVRIAPTEAPALVALSEPGRLYNRALAEYRLRARAADDDRTRGVAHLNVGLAYMHFRAWDRATADGLTRADLPDGAGIGQGTVLYYQGLCALRRGDPEAARAAFQKAATRLGATIESADGPSAAAAAGRALLALQ